MNHFLISSTTSWYVGEAGKHLGLKEHLFFPQVHQIFPHFFSLYHYPCQRGKAIKSKLIGEWMNE